MNIKDVKTNAPALLPDPKSRDRKEEVAMEFEQLFARQLVGEMTKGLFRQDDNKSLMTAGSGIYRQHVIDTLAGALAAEKKLGMADMISKYWDQKSGLLSSVNSESITESKFKQ